MKTQIKSKTQYVQTRMDPEIKGKAEDVLKKLGISPSQAIQMFYYQIYIQKGIPFSLSLPEFMSEEEERKVEIAREQIKSKNFLTYDPSKDSLADILSKNV
jgi:DNA-damage-inducible protein J